MRKSWPIYTIGLSSSPKGDDSLRVSGGQSPSPPCNSSFFSQRTTTGQYTTGGPLAIHQRAESSNDDTAIQNAFKSPASTKRISTVSSSNFRPLPLCSSTFKQACQPTIFSEKYNLKAHKEPVGYLSLEWDETTPFWADRSRCVPAIADQDDNQAKGTAPTLTTTLSFPLLLKYLTSYGGKSTLNSGG